MTRRRDLPEQFRDTAFRLRDARAAGVPRGRLSASDLEVPARGARVPRGGSILEAVAVLLDERQAFCGPTAAKIWGMPLPRRWDDDPRLWVATLSRDRTMRRAGVVGVRMSRAVPVIRSGYRVLEPGSTWASLAGMLEQHDLVAAADGAVVSNRWREAITDVSALAAAAELSTRARRVLRRSLTEVRVGAWSRPESLLRVALTRAGIPEPLLNEETAVSGRRVAVPDLSWPEFRVCAEYDGFWHDDPRERAADLERQELLADRGWLVVRIRARDLFPEPLVAVARILRRLTSRGYTHPGTIQRAPGPGWLP